ncbi:Fic family protein [Sphingomonas sp. Leaf38]|uniref:Fic family protein n=1 Tax=Sphingomonas sp. Leaf38 TaxID=1736217 RepID=UPI0009EB5C1A|nr:Fic family protein [Sphingomonas sp. Leaf38]
MTTQQDVWPPATGITGLDHDGAALASSEIPGIQAVWQDQRERLDGTQQLADFTERLGREWAIETGIIENLYDIDRGITQTLIEHGFHSDILSHGSDHKPKEYVIRVLQDQKDALEGIFDFVKDNRNLSTSYVKELHAALLRSQESTEAIDQFGRLIEVPLIKGDWKERTNFPVRDGTTYAYCPPEHVSAEMDRLIAIHSDHVAQSVQPDVQAAWLHHRFTQIHPFQDGNGRVARAIASLVLVKAGLFPLVVTRDDKAAYLIALEAADAGQLRPLVSLFAKLQRTQLIKATAISENILAADADVSQWLRGLEKAAEKTAEQKVDALRPVFNLAEDLERDVIEQMQRIAPLIKSSLVKVHNTPTAFVTSANEDTAHYFRAQIVENAKENLNYYADLNSYRSWVALNLVWSRKAKLVFAFHGVGRKFSGTLICSPLLEFRDADEEQQVRVTVVPVTDEGFVFFFNESSQTVLDRFRSWRDSVFKVFLQELGQNL